MAIWQRCGDSILTNHTYAMGYIPREFFVLFCCLHLHTHTPYLKSINILSSTVLLPNFNSIHIKIPRKIYIHSHLLFFVLVLVQILFSSRALPRITHQITWIDGAGTVLTTGVEYTKASSPDIRLFTAKSILKLNVNRDLHNRTIHCQAQNSADKTYRTASIRLEVSISL